MVALTYGDGRAASVETATTTDRVETAAPRRSWLSRFFDAMMEARMQQAQREIRLYARLTPSAKGDTTETPFGGW